MTDRDRIEALEAEVRALKEVRDAAYEFVEATERDQRRQFVELVATREEVRALRGGEEISLATNRTLVEEVTRLRAVLFETTQNVEAVARAIDGDSLEPQDAQMQAEIWESQKAAGRRVLAALRTLASRIPASLGGAPVVGERVEVNWGDHWEAGTVTDVDGHRMQVRLDSGGYTGVNPRGGGWRRVASLGGGPGPVKEFGEG